MKYIHITKSFKKHLKKLKKHLSEDDVIDDVEEFMQSGTKKGEALLKEENKFNVKYFKLRVSIKMVDFRYVLGVVSETDYIPVAIDLKKGKYGRNLSFNANKDKKIKLGLKSKRSFPIGANLGMVVHAKAAIESGADTIGLYRTEFLFLIRKQLPTEEDQFNIYKRALEATDNRGIVFRTLDIGGDKYVPYLNLPKESNPSLGWRAIRFSLERKDLFRIQLRALLRASHFGKI